MPLARRASGRLNIGDGGCFFLYTPLLAVFIPLLNFFSR